MHHATPMHKIHSAAGGSEEFVRIPARLSSLPFLLPVCRTQTGRCACVHGRMHVGTSSPVYHTRVCIPTRCFTKCTHCIGFNHPSRGRTSSFGAGNAPRRDNGIACFSRRRRRRKKERYKRARRAETREE